MSGHPRTATVLRPRAPTRAVAPAGREASDQPRRQPSDMPAIPSAHGRNARPTSTRRTAAPAAGTARREELPNRPGDHQHLDEVRPGHRSRAERPHVGRADWRRAFAESRTQPQRDRRPHRSRGMGRVPGVPAGLDDRVQPSISALTSSAAPGMSAPCSSPMPSVRIQETSRKRCRWRSRWGGSRRSNASSAPGVSTPPGSSPIDPPPRRRTSRPRSPLPARPGPGNIVTIIPRITAEVVAPPMPWANRAPISRLWLSARPHSTEAVVNTSRRRGRSACGRSDRPGGPPAIAGRRTRSGTR